MKKVFPVSVRQGGYSEPILQPCYLVVIGLIFLLEPQVGLFFGMLIVGVPAFYIARLIARMQEKRAYTATVRIAPKRAKRTHKVHIKLIPAKAV